MPPPPPLHIFWPPLPPGRPALCPSPEPHTRRPSGRLCRLSSSALIYAPPKIYQILQE